MAETLQAVSLAANAIETRSVQVSHLCTELNQLTKSTQDVLHSRVIQNLFGTIAFVLSAVGFALFELIIPSETSFFFKFPIQIMLLVLIVHFFLLIVK